MGKYLYSLYLDESGSFEADDRQVNRSCSLVGGLLCESSYLTDRKVKELLPEPVHCCEGYKKEYLSVLEQLHRDGCRFVVFENRERLNVINGDLTYLNVLSEGLIRLMRDLREEHPGGVHLMVTVATRKETAARYGRIGNDEYISRLEEKIYMASYRDGTDVADHTVTFSDARSFRKLDFADIICNTWLTRNGKAKFTDGDRERISAVYDPRYIFSVFESATVGSLKRLAADGRYGEAMYEICALPKLAGVADIRNRIIARMEKSLPVEQEGYFSFMSLQIGLLNSRRMHREGVALAENYKKYFLAPMAEHPNLAARARFWAFDTDFYLLTMYDHIGNVSACGRYLEECRRNIGSISRSWEHIDYYFRFRIRELNCLIGRFDFGAALSKSEGLIAILRNAKELFGMIETFDGRASELQSELLGKAYGVQLEVYTNLLARDPGLFEKALEASDRAAAEFTDPADLRRQWLYRGALMLEAGKAEEALACVLGAFGLEPDGEKAFGSFVEQVYGDGRAKDLFALWHYTGVMLALKKENNRAADEMFAALNRSRAFTSDLSRTDLKGYPWNMVLWNMSRWHRLAGSVNSAEKYYSRALAATKEHPEQAVMYSFSVPMAADRLLHLLERGEITAQAAEKEMRRVCSEFGKLDLPDTMRAVFVPPAEEKIDEKTLRRLSGAWLR